MIHQKALDDATEDIEYLLKSRCSGNTLDYLMNYFAAIKISTDSIIAQVISNKVNGYPYSEEDKEIRKYHLFQMYEELTESIEVNVENKCDKT